MADYVDVFINSMKNEGAERRILDVGIGNGENSVRLAETGHTVVGITNCEEEYVRAKRIAQRRGLGKCTFLMMSVEGIQGKFDPNFFDGVIASKVLHFLSSRTIIPTINTLKLLTAPGGWNVIQGYLVDPVQSQSEANREKMFTPGELWGIYAGDIDWQITDYSEDPFSGQIAGGREWVSSLARMIARKSKTPRSRQGR